MNLKSLNHIVFGYIQHVIGSKAWFYWTIYLTLGWILLNAGIVWSGHKPFDSPREFFPFVVLIYTILSLWIENAMKVQQKDQQDLAASQLAKIEELNKKMMESQQVNSNVLSEMARVVKENARQDDVFHDLMSVVDATVEIVAKNTDDILHLVGKKAEGGDR